jgi:hypothetical protein
MNTVAVEKCLKSCWVTLRTPIEEELSASSEKYAHLKIKISLHTAYP